MSDILSDICDFKRQHIAKRKTDVPEGQLLERAREAGAPRGFMGALQNKVKHGQSGLIAEIKKASPSAGVIRVDFDPELLAKAYEKGGAACISVLTDEFYFQGQDDYLSQARAVSTLPVLRKDFMLDPYQVIESRALGADCILLIIAALGDEQARELEAAAFELGMDVLVEVHDEDELERALAYLKSTLIGINNRNLKTLKVDLATSERLVKKLPSPILDQGTVVCESGIASHADIRRMHESGIHCFLVGEALMRERDVARAVRWLLRENYG